MLPDMHAVWKTLLVLGGTLWVGCSAVIAAEGAVLRTAASVHGLSQTEAVAGRAVELEGVVIYFAWDRGDTLFVQDETDGMYVKIAGTVPMVRAGDRLRVRGVTEGGDYAPVVVLREWERLGEGAMPEAVPLTAEQLAGGGFDSRRVELRGLVRAAMLSKETARRQLVLELRSGGQDVLVRVHESALPPASLEDAEVRVRGVATGVFNGQSQMVDSVLLVRGDADLEVMSAPENVDTLPVRSVASLFRYSPQGFPQRRLRLEGTVQGFREGRWLAVRDATGGVMVELREGHGFAAGDTVSLTGFPELRGQTLWLARADAVRRSAGSAPKTVRLPVREAFLRPLELVELRGKLTADPYPTDGGWALTLAGETGSFEAIVPNAGNVTERNWRPGAVLAVRGVTEPVFVSREWMSASPFPQTLRLLARGAEDVSVLVAEPWWTSPQATKRIAWSLAAVLVLLGGVSLATLALARKNRELREARSALGLARDELAQRFADRTGQWREQVAARHAAEADFTLLTAERTRLARELHDTLEQSLASVALQLDASAAWLPKDEAQAVKYLRASANQLRLSQQDVRRSVWGLRALALEDAGLGEALEQMVGALADASGPAISVELTGLRGELPATVAGHLFRVAQEGITNALKHASARHIRLLLHQETDAVTLRVRDDGVGFDTARVPTDAGHFGLNGMAERLAALAGELEIQSTAGEGTEVRVRVPLPQAGNGKN